MSDEQVIRWWCQRLGWTVNMVAGSRIAEAFPVWDDDGLLRSLAELAEKARASCQGADPKQPRDQLDWLECLKVWGEAGSLAFLHALYLALQ